MGISSSKPAPPIIGRMQHGGSSIPPYCVKSVGSRHILVGGGGGTAKTGVPNAVEQFLLTYDILPSSESTCNELRARESLAIETSNAVMNMDVIAMGPPTAGRYLLATGQEEYCHLYISDGFGLTSNECDQRPTLSITFSDAARVRTDQSDKESYQKSVRFDRSGRVPLRLVTGGADGHIHIWAISNAPQIAIDEERAVQVGNAVVDDIDISTCGRIVATVSAVKKSVQQTTQTQKTVLMQKVGFWDADSGEEKAVLPCLPGSGDAFKVRSLRFLNVGSKQNAYFVAAYNQKVQSKQCETYLAIWGFDKTKNSFHLKQKQKAGNEIISTLSVCPSGDYIAVGTSAGSVAMFDTHTLQRIYIAAETHKNFVTAVEFLPQRTLDIAGETLPGVCSEAMCSVVSVSVDNEIQIHRAQFPEETAFSTQLLRIALHCLILYFLGWLLFK